MKRMPVLAGALMIAAVGSWTSQARAVPFEVTYEAPGVQSANETALCSGSGLGPCTIGVETFDGEPLAENPSTENFTTNFGTGGVIQGTYTNVQVYDADEYGGAGGTGEFADTHSSTGYSLTLTTTLSTGLNYFGFWLSALDMGNIVTFYDDGTEVYQFTPTDLLSLIGDCPNPYCGNPNSDFLDDNSAQPYVFLNFFDLAGSFNEIVFTENPEVGGYESDNQTVGYVTGLTGTPIDVPEPGSLALLTTAFCGLLLARTWRRV